MKKILVVGGNSGIGEAFVKKVIEDSEVICLNRKGMSWEHQNLSSYTFDAMEDDLPIQDNIDSLVYFPGSINLKPFKNLTDKDFLNDLEVNLFGAIKTIRKALPLLNKNGKSSIVLFSTVAVALGMPYHTSVSAAKGAIEGFAKSLASELAPHIRVNVVAPSIVDTPLASRILSNEKSIENAKNRHPLKSIGEANDIASMVNFIMSDDAKWITGQVFHIDGGMSSIKGL